MRYFTIGLPDAGLRVTCRGEAFALWFRLIESPAMAVMLINIDSLANPTPLRCGDGVPRPYGNVYVVSSVSTM